MTYTIRDSLGQKICSVESNTDISYSFGAFNLNFKDKVLEVIKSFESTQILSREIIDKINNSEILGFEANVFNTLGEKIKNFFKSIGDWFKKCFGLLNTSDIELKEIDNTPEDKKLKGAKPDKLDSEYFRCNVTFSNDRGAAKTYKKLVFKISDFDSIFNSENDRIINTITNNDINGIFTNINKYNSKIDLFLNNIGNKNFIKTNKIEDSESEAVIKSIEKCFIDKSQIKDKQNYIIYMLNELDYIVNSLASGYLKDESDWLMIMNNKMKSIEEDASNGKLEVSKEAIEAITNIHKQVNSIIAGVVSLIRSIVIVYGKLENEMIRLGKKHVKIMETIITGTDGRGYKGRNANFLMKYSDSSRLSYAGRFIIGTSHTIRGSEYINNSGSIMYLKNDDFNFVNETFLKIYSETGTYDNRSEMFCLSGKSDSPIYSRSKDSVNFKKAMDIVLNSSLNGKVLGTDNYETFGHYVDYVAYKFDEKSTEVDFEVLTIDFNFVIYEKTIVAIKPTDVLYHTSPSPNLKSISGFALSGDSWNHYATERVYFNINEPIHRAGFNWEEIYNNLLKYTDYKAAKTYVYAVKNPEKYRLYKDPLLSKIKTCVYIDSKSIEVDDVTSKFPIIAKINEFLDKHPTQVKKTQ